MYGTTSLPMTGSGAAAIGMATHSPMVAVFAILAFWTLIAAYQVFLRVIPKKEM